MKTTIICVLMAVSALTASSYESKNMRELAQSHYTIIKNNIEYSGSNALLFMDAREFRGYIASMLDFNPAFDKCLNGKSLNSITYKASSLIATTKLAKDTDMRISALVALDMICNPTK